MHFIYGIKQRVKIYLQYIVLDNESDKIREYIKSSVPLDPNLCPPHESKKQTKSQFIYLLALLILMFQTPPNTGIITFKHR